MTDYENLIPALTLPDPDDRHILAAAIRAHASVIVTFNEADFPAGELEKFGIHCRHPDDFILDVFGIDEESCVRAIEADIAHYRVPPLTLEDYIASLKKAGIPKSAAFLGGIKIMFE